MKERLHDVNWTNVLLFALLLSSLANLGKEYDIETKLNDMENSVVEVRRNVSSESEDIQSKLEDIKSELENIEANQ